MSLLPCTRRIIEQVERVTNRPVVVREDVGLKVLADIKIARGDDAVHLVRYKAGGGVSPDYYIVYQCGHLLRFYSAPPEKRFETAARPEASQKLADEMLKNRIPSQAQGLGEMLLGGLITQLRSIPVGFRIEDWITSTFPELADQQRCAVQNQLTQNLETIRIAASPMIPRLVSKASVTMNAAFALFWARKWGDTSLTIPYKSAGYLDLAMKLIGIIDRTPDDASSDVQLIDEWAFELKLKGWYEAIPFRSTT